MQHIHNCLHRAPKLTALHKQSPCTLLSLTLSLYFSLCVCTSLSLSLCTLCCVSGCAVSVHQQLAWWSGIMASLQTGCGFNSHLSHQPTHPTSYLQYSYIHKFCSLMPTSKLKKMHFHFTPPTHSSTTQSLSHSPCLFVLGRRKESWPTRKHPNFF